MKIGLFIPCYINAVYPEVGVASYKLLKSIGLDVDYPLDQTCCGQQMPDSSMNRQGWRCVWKNCSVRTIMWLALLPVVSLS